MCEKFPQCVQKALSRSAQRVMFLLTFSKKLQCVWKIPALCFNLSPKGSMFLLTFLKKLQCVWKIPHCVSKIPAMCFKNSRIVFQKSCKCVSKIPALCFKNSRNVFQKSPHCVSKALSESAQRVNVFVNFFWKSYCRPRNLPKPHPRAHFDTVSSVCTVIRFWIKHNKFFYASARETYQPASDNFSKKLTKTLTLSATLCYFRESA